MNYQGSYSPENSPELIESYLTPADRRMFELEQALTAITSVVDRADDKQFEDVVAFKPKVESPEETSTNIVALNPLEQAIRQAQSAQDIGQLYTDEAFTGRAA